MKTIKRIFGMLAIVSAIIFMDACKGEKGDVGPIGTTGPIGPSGVNGAVGAAGPTGTANVIYSEWTPITLTGSYSSSGTTNVTCSKITQEIIDKGIIFSYIKFGTFNYSLPLSFPISGDKDQTIAARYVLGSTSLISNFANSTGSFRYVVIPGGVAGGRRATIDYNNYEEVKKYYNLPD